MQRRRQTDVAVPRAVAHAAHHWHRAAVTRRAVASPDAMPSDRPGGDFGPSQVLWRRTHLGHAAPGAARGEPQRRADARQRRSRHTRNSTASTDNHSGRQAFDQRAAGVSSAGRDRVSACSVSRQWANLSAQARPKNHPSASRMGSLPSSKKWAMRGRGKVVARLARQNQQLDAAPDGQAALGLESGSSASSAGVWVVDEDAQLSGAALVDHHHQRRSGRQ